MEIIFTLGIGLVIIIIIFSLIYGNEVIQALSDHPNTSLIGLISILFFTIIMSLVYTDNQEEILCASHCPTGYTLASTKCICQEDKIFGL